MPSAPKPSKPALIASNTEGVARQQDLEAAMRRRMAGAAANILTSPTGIPGAGGVSTLGGA